MTVATTNKQTLEAYDKGAAMYAANQRAGMSDEVRTWLEVMLAGLPKAAKILEIGSGTGRDADYVESLGYAVERTDGSQGFVTYQQAAGKPIRLLNILTDTLNTSYDLIFANAVFLHFTEEECAGALQNTHDALRANGRLALSLKRGSGEETTTEKLNAPRYFRYWEPESVTALLEGAGFTNIQIAINDDWREDKPQWLFITAIKGGAK